MSSTSAFLVEQLGPHYAGLEILSFPCDANEKNLIDEKWPTPRDGIGVGTLPSGRPFLICKYSENGAPIPPTTVLELIYYEKMVRKPLADRTPSPSQKNSRKKKPSSQERWVSLRRVGEETTATKIDNLFCIRAMLDDKGPEATNHREFISS